MTGTDIREALHEIADSTVPPAPDRLAFQRQVRRERRALIGGRAVLAGAVAATVAVAATAVVPLLGGGSVKSRVATTPQVVDLVPEPGAVDLDTPLYYVAGGRLIALTPQGKVLDLGLRSEGVVGWTSESVFALSLNSEWVQLDVSNSEEGPGGWTFERVDTEPVRGFQGIELSADGRWLAWIDLENRLFLQDGKAGTTTDPVDVGPNAALVDVAQGTGFPLVSEDGDLVLHTDAGKVPIPTEGDGYGLASTASRDLVAVGDRDDTTRVYDVSSGAAELAGEVRGTGYLSAYGTHLVSVASEPGDAGASVLLWSPGRKTVRLETPGVPMEAAWADDDTFVVTSRVDGRTVLLGCEALDPRCSVLVTEGVDDVRLDH
jgi:hypothetical protein